MNSKEGLPVRLRRGETPEKITEWRASAASGDVEAMLNIATIAARTPEDAHEAEHWLRRACEQGSLEAKHLLGVALIKKGDLGEGERLLRGSADAGHVEAMYTLYHYYDSRGLRDEAQKVWDSIPDGK
ncbi:tetratricopeptide repeat protein [Streptomyces sp. NPDC050743]|uniref:tetratricopeptide repeat protein n=1 Tax=Streptomyces sp. NPDC050743 TaxID=3365634 RepID=UPI0037A4E510